MKPTIGTSDGRAIALDLDRLVTSRMLLCANSGAGKSWALRRLLEQTHGKIQQLVIDPEGEFYTLRGRFDYVLAGRGGDCPAEPRSADMLARKLLELGTSAILDLYELAPRDRVRFVRAFLEALVDAPRKLWHPALVVVDEAQAFAPEKGHGEAESSGAVARLMAQGRKRGFCGVLATQRLSKLAKDVAAEANNLLIGRAALDLDVRRASEVLGLAKDRHAEIRKLPAGHFFAFGPALAEDVVRVEVGPVETEHPRAGAQATPTPAPTAKVRSVLAELADLPAEAEAEAKTAAELRAKVATLERELRAAKSAAPEPTPEQLKAAAAEVWETAMARIARIHSQYIARDREFRARLDAIVDATSKAGDVISASIQFEPGEMDAFRDLGKKTVVSRTALAVPLKRPDLYPETAGAARADVGSGAMRMLQILAQYHPAGLPEGQWAALAGLKRSGGTWSTYKSRLRTAGYMREERGLYFATDDGVAAAGVVQDLPTTAAELIELWRGKPGMRPVMPLVEAVQNGCVLSRAELAERCNLAADGGTFSTYLSRAVTAGLLGRDGTAIVLGPAFEGLA